MKKIIALFLALVVCTTAHAQNFTVNTLRVTGNTSMTYPPVITGVCQNILSYGGAGDGVTANDTALASLLAAEPTGKKCVYFPPGKFKFASPVTYTMVNSIESLTITGAGADQTELTWGATNGLTINYIGSFNTVHIRDLTVSTSGIGAGTAIYLHQNATNLPNPALTALSDITNVTIRGADGYVQTDYWATGVNVYGVSNINFVGMQVWGPSCGGCGSGFTTVGMGVNVSGTSTLFPVVFNFSGCYFGWIGSGIQYGAYVQGMTVTQTNFIGGSYGIVVPSGLIATTLDQLAVSNSQFNVGNAGIYEQTYVANSQFNGNLFLVASNSQGISLAQSCMYSITGNSFNLYSATNLNGIVIAGSACGGVISGNTFSQMTTAVFLQSTSTGANVQSNFYLSNGTNVVNSGTGNTVGGGSQ